MNRILLAILLFVGLSAPSGPAQPSANPSPRGLRLPPGVKMLKDLEYGRGDGRAMLLDLYLPKKGEKPLALLIWIHGGAWMSGSKDDPSPALRFTADGYAVAHVGYRLSQEAKFPAQIQDCKAAVRWLRANAQKYGKLSRRVTSLGASLRAIGCSPKKSRST